MRLWNAVGNRPVFIPRPNLLFPVQCLYRSELETLENTLLELELMSRIVPIIITRITASITAYSAMSSASSVRQSTNRLSTGSVHVLDFRLIGLISPQTGEEGQDIAEYAVMLAVILVLVVGTIRLVGSNANTAFSSVASSLQ